MKALPALFAALLALAPAGPGLFAQNLAPQDIVFPADAGVIEVKRDYGAKGDGRADDTAALQAAITESLDRFRIIYLPAGTYLVSDQLSLGPDLFKAKGVSIYGESRSRTVIKLKDRAPGFTDPAQPRRLLSFFEGKQTGQAFHNHLCNLTVDIGAGNPGAVGVRFIANNQGAMRDVIIRTSDPARAGSAGLDLTAHETGPQFIQRIAVEGFSFGIRVRDYSFSSVLEDIVLRDQTEAAIDNTHQSLSFNRLRSFNKVPVLVGREEAGQIVFLNSEFTGGASSTHALTGKNIVVLQNVSQSGYKGLHEKIPGAKTDYATNGKTHDQARPFGLPVEDAPVIPWDDPKNWVRVESPGGKENDASGALQAAIDRAAKEGKSTVYFSNFGCGPQPRFPAYTVSKSIRVHGSVRALRLNHVHLTVADPLLNSGRGLFVLENLEAPAILIENAFFLPFKKGKMTTVEDRSGATVVLRSLCHNFGREVAPYRKTGGAPNKVFVEDVVANNWHFARSQQVWMRQINPESNLTGIHNKGAKLWILGLKTEGWGTVVETSDGGVTEVWGGLLLGSWPKKEDVGHPAFVSRDGGRHFVSICQGSALFTNFSRGPGGDIPGKQVLRNVAALSSE